MKEKLVREWFGALRAAADAAVRGLDEVCPLSHVRKRKELCLPKDTGREGSPLWMDEFEYIDGCITHG